MFVDAIMLSLLAGSAIFIGALIASHEHIRPDWLEEEFHHSITALGAGALLAAIALVLVPEGLQQQSIATAVGSFLAGGAGAMALDRHFAKRKSTAAQLVAMLLDFVPETIVIGAIITKNQSEALLLTLIIFVQNLPESFSSFREMRAANRMSARQLLQWFGLIAISGPVFVWLGAAVLADHSHWLAMLMTFCAGGILYLVFNDIAPQVKLENRFFPPMGGLIGFSIGLIGYALTGG